MLHLQYTYPSISIEECYIFSIYPGISIEECYIFCTYPGISIEECYIFSTYPGISIEEQWCRNCIVARAVLTGTVLQSIKNFY